jgi:ATP-dependent exoDNAse (exonuclease V) beta subunit
MLPMSEQQSLFAVPIRDMDEEARERALAVKESFIVQAPAGSGKTELLVQRFLSLLTAVREPENIVAITFTRKAAGEMRARVTDALREAASTKLPPDEGHKRKRWELAHKVLAHDQVHNWNLLQSPGRLRIVTIDSLCHRIVKQMPWTSELGVIRGVADKADDLYSAAAHRTVQLIGNGGPIAEDLRRALIHLDNGVPQLEDELIKMLRRRDQWLRHMEMGEPARLRAQMEDTLRRLVSEKLEQIKHAIPKDLRDELARLAAVAANNLRVTKPTHPIVACVGLSGFPESIAEALPVWTGMVLMMLTNDGTWRSPRAIHSGLGFPPTCREEKNALLSVMQRLAGIPKLREILCSVRGLPPARFTDPQWQILESFVRLLPVAVAQLRTVFSEQQNCDHSEVASAALHALRNEGKPTDPAFALGHSIEHLLVDEFQDTSVSQVRLLESLTAGWKSQDGRTLFLVGDPMQSIYRFRQAEVGSFIGVANKGKFGKIVVEPLRLEKNFRSRQTIVDWVNQTFPTVFPATENLTVSAVQFVECRAAARDRERPSIVKVHAFFGEKEQPRLREAREVLEVIRDLRGRQEKVAVLVRSRQPLFHVLGQLRSAAADEPELRFQAVEIDDLAEQIVISDLRALTHALLHLGNRVAWLAILRAPWCGLTLRDLHTLVADAPHSTVWQLIEQRRSQLSEDAQARLARMVPVLREALSRRGRLPLRQWVESTWISLNGPACLKNNRELEDAATFFDLLDELDSGSEIASLASFEKSIDGLFSQPDPDATDAIQVMTIHKAKGLEFDAVLLPGLGRYTRGEDRSLLLWDESTNGNGPELLMAPMRPKGGDKDPIYEFLKSIEAERSANETRRLLYVAVTRAKHELHLFGDLGCTSQEFMEEAKEPDGRSLLSLLWPAVRNEFIAQAQADASESIRIEAAADVPPKRMLRRLPLSWKTPALPGAVDWQPSPEPEQIDAEDDVTYDWAGERARRVGTVVHAVLQRIAAEGLANWNEARIQSMRPALRSALANQGVSPADMSELLTRTERAIVTAVTDTRGRWILQERVGAESEYALTGMLGDQLNTFVIDRTFVADGIRWIIDYKTGSREGGDPEAFLENEKIRYQEKMERYAEIFRAFDPTLPVKLGLYFPLMNGWREWVPGASR